VKDYLQLDSFVNEANKDEDIVYIIIQDAQGNIITSQYSSINYRSPRFATILARLSKDSELRDIIEAVKKQETVTEISAPIETGIDVIGKVTICMSQQIIYQEMIKTIFIVVALNVAVALALGAVLFVSAKKMILTPVAELADAAARLAKGELSTQVTVKATGELQFLIDSFNRMSGDLQKTTVSKKYVDDILASMRDTLIVASSDGTITRINMAASFLLGYDETELVGERLGWVVMDEPGAEKTTLDTILENSSISSVEKTYLDRNGKMVPMLFSASVMRGSDGQVHGVVCVAQNITERKKAEEKLHNYSEELKEINEEIKNFAYIISHDLRAPLVNIKGFSDELVRCLGEVDPILDKHLEEGPSEEQEKLRDVLKKDIPEALSFIGSSVNRMDNLITAILKLSRAGRRDLSPEPVSIQELVRSIADSLTHQLGVKSARVTLQEGLPEVIADRTALGQIFGNLLDNAVKYLEPGRAGSIEIFAEREDGEVVFHVRDNGRGMAQEDIPRAFEIFRRVGQQDVPGEGMGLAYVKALVRRQGGRIWCVSEPGKGTTFSFTLPQAGKPKGAD
jgi:PAS domain S-box-containing protein